MFQKKNSQLLSLCLSAARSMLYPSYLTFNCLLSLFINTFQEEKHPYRVLIKKIILTPVYLTLFALFLPLMAVFLPIRCLLVSIRFPFQYSEKHTNYTQEQTEIINYRIINGDHSFGIASANVCLMPELVSKMNHITNVDLRAKTIGERIVVSQFFNQAWNAKELHWKMESCKYESINGKGDGDRLRDKAVAGRNTNSMVGCVTVTFPFLDFLVVQEAWSSYHNKALINQLHKTFPYIIHDVGVHSFSNNRFFLSSGLLLASKHPIVAVDFKPYSNFTKHGKLMSMGLLMVKVSLGKVSPRQRKRNVGYVFNTHLQSYQGNEAIIPKQLDEVLLWTKQFIKDKAENGDDIWFSFLCGDFNFDNLSPADAQSTKHKLFEVFEDVCRLRAGCDKHWTVGTEMRQQNMFESLVTTSEGLKVALEDPALRQSHIVDGDIEEPTKEAIVHCSIKKDAQNNVQVFPQGGRRRIDYILYQKSYPLNIEGFNFVTQLASLTDHIPVAMEFTCM